MDSDEAERLCRKRAEIFALKRRLKLTRSTRSAQYLGVAVRNEWHRLNRMKGCIDASSRPGLESFERKQDEWDRSVHNELVAMAREQGIPIHAGDSSITASDHSAKGYEQKFLYDSQDLLVALQGVSDDIQQSELEGTLGAKRQWSNCSFGLAPKSLQQLRIQFADLDPSICQVGVDDGDDEFMRKHEVLGGKLLRIGSIQLIERYLRQGCSASLRTKLYRVVLQDSSNLVARTTNKSLIMKHDEQKSQGKGGKPKEGSEEKAGKRNRKYELEERTALKEVSRVFDSTVVDRLHALDLKLIRDNDNYFVFEDLLRNILPVLFREHMDWLRLHSRVVSRLEHIRAVPFYGFALQAAPLAYLFQSETEIVLCLRSIFARYWCQLNVVRNSPIDGSLTLLPNLCSQFEYLVQTTCPRALYHMNKLGVPPLEIAFEWIHLAFSSVLSVDILFHLWDRILGFDSLLPLPILAAAIFKYREETILQIDSADEIRELMKQTNKLNAIALMQAFLFT